MQARKQEEEEEAAWEASRAEADRKRVDSHHAATLNRQLRDMLGWQRLLARNPRDPVIKCAPDHVPRCPVFTRMCIWITVTLQCARITACSRTAAQAVWQSCQGSCACGHRASLNPRRPLCRPRSRERIARVVDVLHEQATEALTAEAGPRPEFVVIPAP